MYYVEYLLFCSNLDKYLKSINNDLVQYESISIKKPLLTTWSYIANLSNERTIGNKTDFCYSIKMEGSLSMIGSIIYVDEKGKRYKKLYIKNIVMSNERIKYVFESMKVNSYPIFTIKLLKLLSENECLFIIKHKFLEYTSCKYICDLGKLKRHTLKKVKEQLEEVLV